MKTALVLALLLIAALSATSCIPPDGLRNVKPPTPDQVIRQAPVQEGIEKARLGAVAIAATLLLIMCLLTAYHVYFGGDSPGGSGEGLRWTRGFLVWAVVSLFVIGSIGRDHWFSLDWALRRVGWGLAEYIEPPGTPFAELVDHMSLTALAGKQLRLLLAAGRAAADGGLSERDMTAMAVAEWEATPFGAFLFWANSVGVLVMTWLLKISLAWLLAFYTLLGPVMAVALILPWTRPMFWGYLRTYLSLCLWPMLIGVAERVASAIPWAAMGAGVEAGVTTRDPFVAAVAFGTGAMVSFLANVMFFFVYLSVPIAAARLVNSAGLPFRNR